MIHLYGIRNCDTVKKAMKHLDQNKVQYQFVDFKKTPPQKKDIQRWKKVFGDWPVNKKGRTFRQLQEEFDAASAADKVELIIENTSLIKRPILENANEPICFGYDQDTYDSI